MADPTYNFPSLAPYVDKALDDAKVEDPEMRLLAREGVHAARITDALSQLPLQAKEQAAGRFPPGTVKGVFDYIKSIRDSLAAQVEGLDAAIADAKKAAGALATQAAEAKPVLRAAPVYNPDSSNIADLRNAKAGKVTTHDSPPPPAFPGDEPQPSPTAIADEGKALMEPSKVPPKPAKTEPDADAKAAGIEAAKAPVKAVAPVVPPKPVTPPAPPK